MFKAILATLVAVGFSSVAFAAGEAMPPPAEPTSMDKPADMNAMPGDHKTKEKKTTTTEHSMKGGKMKHTKKTEKTEKTE